MQPLSPRFTLRSMKELDIPIPSIYEQVVYEPRHKLLREMKRLFQCHGEDYPFERIKSIDDNFLKRVKINGYRAAIWANIVDNDHIWWIVAGGIRKGLDRDDFYQNLELKCRAALKDKRRLDSSFRLGKDTYSDWLLPAKEDYDLLTLTKIYIKSLAEIEEMNQTFDNACRNLNQNLICEFKNTHIEIESISENEFYFTFYVTQYDPEFHDNVALIFDELGFDEQCYDEVEVRPSYRKNPRYIHSFYAIKP